MSGVQFKLEGLKEILDALKSLNPKTLYQIIRAVNRRDLAKNIIKQVRAAIPYSPRDKKAIQIVNDKINKTGVFAGATSKAFWLRFVEKGTKERKTKSGKSLGKVNPRPVIIPTIDSRVNEVINFFNKDFGSEVDKVLIKKLKKLKKK